MDENSVSFQMFFKILLSFITLGSENQISVLKECQSNTLRCLVIWGVGGGGWGWEHAQTPKFGEIFQ